MEAEDQTFQRRDESRGKTPSKKREKKKEDVEEVDAATC